MEVIHLYQGTSLLVQNDVFVAVSRVLSNSIKWKLCLCVTGLEETSGAIYIYLNFGCVFIVPLEETGGRTIAAVC
jgi:hypothetical protein